MNANLHKFLFIFCFSFFVHNTIHAQLIIDQTLTNQQLAQSLVGSGVAISNVTITCGANSYGRFEAGTSNIGLPEGVLLTTGNVTEVANPSSFFMSSTIGTPGDPTLNQIVAPQTTNDACVMQFDVIPQGDTLRFRYRFGSEEYPDYVCSQFNDVFGFFISGPNPAGGNYNQNNIAIIPGTNLPVAINSINSGIPGIFGAGGCNGPGESLAYSALYVNNELPGSPTFGTIAFDGITTTLTAEIEVVPCETYTLKLAVADVVDGAFDSGVFIEELTSPEITLGIETEAGTPFAIAGCNNGILTFTSNFTSQDPITVFYSIGGDAVPGINYEPFQDSVTIMPGDTSATVTVVPLIDTFGVGGDSIVISLINPCTNQAFDSVVLFIQNQIEIEVPFTDTTICEGESVQLGVSGAFLYNWTPTNSLDNPNIADPVATPTDTTIYQVVGRIGLCPPDTAEITINVSPQPFVFAGPDLTICQGDSVVISDAISDANSVSWEPTGSLVDPNVVNPVAFPTVSTEYFFTGDNNGCSFTDSMIIFVETELNLSVSADTSICEGNSVQLFATGGANYSWTPTASLNNPNSANPIATPTDTTTYVVVATSNNCPPVTDSVTVNVIPVPGLQLPQDEVICIGDTVELSAQGGDTYSWSPSNSLSADDVSTVLAFPQTTTTYTLVTTTAICDVTGTVTVEVNNLPDVIAADDFTACTNEEFTLSASGANVYSWSPEDLLDNPDTQNPTAELQNTTTFYVVGTNTLTGCSNIDSMTVTIEGPVADAGEDISFCTGDSGFLNAQSPAAGNTYEWITTSGLSNAQILNPEVSLTNPGSSNLIEDYVFAVTDANGCVAYDTVAVTVFPSAQADIFVVSPPADNQGNYVIMEGESAIVNVIDGVDCSWSPTTGIDNPLSCSVSMSPDTTTTYTVTSLSPDGCDAIASVTIFVEFEKGVIVPSGFTPDGDGLNDVLKPILTGTYQLEEFKIFNRWGQLLFETTDENIGWDGTFQGAEQPVAVYVYYLIVRDHTGDTEIIKGNVTLLR
ncbi:MAG: gliding motility-associated C-terminal domain-containing protein [Chitinophagaceae bacterium]|nr:MAG: gliding motility-associated C-terminal domain-containing protein [Chitinophagaceae bacterium]